MKNLIITLVGIITVIFLIAGCGPTRLEMDYGTSYQLQKYNQILNPGAGKNADPVVGINGQAAQNTVDKYKQGFEAGKETSTVYQISVGDIGGGK